MQSGQWLRNPIPNSEVVAILDKALKAAKKGQLRSVLVVTVNPLHETEYAVAGVEHRTHRTVLVGELARAYAGLLKD